VTAIATIQQLFPQNHRSIRDRTTKSPAFVWWTGLIWFKEQRRHRKTHKQISKTEEKKKPGTQWAGKWKASNNTKKKKDRNQLITNSFEKNQNLQTLKTKNYNNRFGFEEPTYQTWAAAQRSYAKWERGDAR
jgi:hypothetical protein